MPYLAPFESNQVPITNKTMNKAAMSHEPYVDLRNLVPWNVYRPHKSQIDSILLHGIKAYTGGTSASCAATRILEDLACITRDSGALSLLELKDGELFASSSNGSTRSYPLNQ